MAFIYADRVKEQSASLGVGDFILTGAIVGFRTFSVGVGDTNSTYYTITNTDNTWEVGIGTINGVVLSRDTVLSSSNGGVAVNFAAGTKTVFTNATSQLHTNTLTAGGHALIDHATQLGVPAPEAFDLGAHAAEDHALQLGVPAPEVFTELAHNDAGFSHAGLPGIPVVGAPGPSAYGINRATALTTFNLISTTDGIHFLSMDATGLNLGVVTCNVSPTPNDSYPFVVVFNEDFHNKGAVINVVGLASAPLIALGPRQGCRLWHTGATTNEYQVELIEPQNGAPSEMLRLFYGNVQLTNAWFTRIFGIGELTQTPLEPDEHSFPVASPTRFMALSWKSQSSGGLPTSLSVLDEAEVVLQSPTLPVGVEGVQPLNFEIVPVAGAATNTTKAINLKYLSGGDKNNMNIALFGFSRDGGIELHYTRSAGAAFVTYPLINGNSSIGLFTMTNTSSQAQVCPADAVLDRITVMTSGTVTFDLNILVAGAIVDTITVAPTGEIALLVNLANTIRVNKGTTLEFTVTNSPSVAPFPGNILVTARLTKIPGFVIPFGAILSGGVFLQLGRYGGEVSTTTDQPQGALTVPIDIRVLRVAWLSENNNSGAGLSIIKNGTSVFSITDSQIQHSAQVVDTPGLTFLAGDRMEIQATGFGFGADDTHILVHATAL